MIDAKIVIDRKGEIILEEFASLGRKYKQYENRAWASALKSEGFRLKNIIRDAVKGGGPPGVKWDRLNPHTGVVSKRQRSGRIWYVKNYRASRRKGEKGKRIYRQVMLSTRTAPLAKFAGAVRYQYDSPSQTMTIGFIAPRMRELAILQAKGFTSPVTPRVRRMMFALGFPLKKETTQLVTPPRPLIEPIFISQREAIRRNVIEKFSANIMRYLQEKAAA